MNITFLFGSGVSYGAGMPKTACISRAILEGKINSQKCGLDNRNEEYNKEELDEIIAFIKIVKEISEKYIATSKDGRDNSTNYEDWYYFIKQLDGRKRGNPLAGYFRDKIMKGENDNDINFGKILDCWNNTQGFLIEKTINYINDAVWNELRREIGDIGYFKFLGDAIKENNKSIINIISLNHDLVLEEYFKKDDIEYENGFTEDNNLKVWDPYNSFTAENKPKLLKLHGSINWFRIKNPVEHWRNRVIIGDYEDLRKEIKIKRRPEILIGRSNKILQYSDMIYNDIFARFKYALYETDRLIVSGYGFEDEGINNYIMEWLYSRKTDKFILIQKYPELLNWIGRGWFQFNKHRFGDKVKLIEKWIQEVKWTEIRG